jgi:addiction module HigA family antidote
MIILPGIDPQMIANNLTPSEPIHPGELLKDELEARGISQARLAKEIGMSASLLNEIVRGKRAVTTEYALLFEAALGIDADFWLRTQAAYNKQVAQADANFMQRLAEIRKLAAML